MSAKKDVLKKLANVHSRTSSVKTSSYIQITRFKRLNFKLLK